MRPSRLTWLTGCFAVTTLLAAVPAVAQYDGPDYDRPPPHYYYHPYDGPRYDHPHYHRYDDDYGEYRHHRRYLPPPPPPDDD